MYKYILIVVLLITLHSIIIVYWLSVPTHTLSNSCTINDLVDSQIDMEKAIRKMGPYYNYSIAPDGTLRVNRGDGRWLKLKYRKGD